MFGKLSLGHDSPAAMVMWECGPVGETGLCCPLGGGGGRAQPWSPPW